MSKTDSRDAIGVAVLYSEARLAVTFTDLGRVAKFVHRPLDEGHLAALHRRFDALLTRPASRAVDDEMGALCAELFGLLIPEPIMAALRGVHARLLLLQLHPAFAWVPWELAHDGESSWGERFAIGRQLVSDQPGGETAPRTRVGGRPRIVVIACGGHERAGSEVARRLGALLQAIDGVEVRVLSEPGATADALHALVRDGDVVHCVGPMRNDSAGAESEGWRVGEQCLELRALAEMPAPPSLLISHDCSAGSNFNALVAERSYALGLTTLVCTTAPSDDVALDFLDAFYRTLARGATAAEALRQACTTYRGRNGLAATARLRAALYGDAQVAIADHNRPMPAVDDLRQVTVVAIDLVGSTRLMATLGAERYSDVLAQYHERIGLIVAACHGRSDDPQGDDGTMCYFGFPVAREDAAHQALRAAFEIVEAMRVLDVQVRIGVATGQVVVRNGQPVGSVVHLAARLQSVAAPDTVLASNATRRMTKTRYRFRVLDDVPQLKGFDRPGPIYVVREAPLPGEADDTLAPAPALSPFVGRSEELAALLGHWSDVQTGSARVVRVLGEAGIGKSRLAREFKYALAGRGHDVFECRCALDHVNSAFQPVVDWLRRELHMGEDDAPQEVLEKVAALVAGIDVEGAVPLLAGLLSPRVVGDQAVLALPPERRRERTLELLVALSKARLRAAPACLIVEDVHWIDPSSGEFLDRLAAEAQALPLLMLLTGRSDREIKWRPRCELRDAELRGLSPEASRVLVLASSGDARLPRDVVHQLAARSDGVPLFIEESTRMVIELSAGLSIDAVSPMPAVPEPILDLLTARLDHLGDAKRVAQIGGTIGREFSLRLLCAVLADEQSPFRVRDVNARLAELVRSGILIGLSSSDGPRYLFKHALMRDAAYGSLLARDRARLHRVVASVVSEQFRALADSQPELLAFHYAEAGLDADALRHWEIAARRAASRSAHVESISHLNSALTVLARVPPGEARDRVELRLQLLLAARLIATEGYGAERVERVYARAMALATTLGDDAALMKVMLGVEGFHFMRADFDKAHAIAVDALGRAQGHADAVHRVQAQWAVANILMHRGDMQAAVELMDTCREQYDQIEHRAEAVQDPGVMCLCYSAWAMWQLGYPDRALERATAVVARAEKLKHKFSMGEAYGFKAAVHHFRGENAQALQDAARAVAICDEGGFAVWLAHARLIHGRAMTEVGDLEAGIEEMRMAYDLWASTGAVVTTPFYLALRAEGLALAGRCDEGLALLERGLLIVESRGERYYEAEVRRLIGKLTLQSSGSGRFRDAESWMQGAMAAARSRQLNSLILRCANSLAELYLAQRRFKDAAEILVPARNLVREGTSTSDLVKSAELLAAAGAEGMPDQ